MPKVISNRSLVISLLITLIAIYFIFPAISFAATAPGIPYWGPFVSCSDGCSWNDLIQTFLNIVYFGMTIALFFVAPVLFAWGGILILTSSGNPGNIEKGKEILTGTIIGVVITLSSFLIIKVFVSFLGITGIGGFGS